MLGRFSLNSRHIRRRLPLVSKNLTWSISKMVESKPRYLKDLLWKDLGVPLNQLNCRHSLVQGQCFNWYHLAGSAVNEDIWVGVVLGYPIAFRQNDTSSYYAPLLPPSSSTSSREEDADEVELDIFIRSYLQLDTDLEALYSTWSHGCTRMQHVTQALPGVRVLRQPPWECLISFICSSNNNIKRITTMLDRLKRVYGTYVCSIVAVDLRGVAVENTDGYKNGGGTHGERPCEYQVIVSSEPPVIDIATFSSITQEGDGEGEEDKDKDEDDPTTPVTPSPKRKRACSSRSSSTDKYLSSPNKCISNSVTVTTPGENNNKGSSTSVHLFTFPTIQALAAAREEDLRTLGMGYRAKFLKGTAEKIIGLGGLDWLLGLRQPQPEVQVQVQHIKKEEKMAITTPLFKTNKVSSSSSNKKEKAAAALASSEIPAIAATDAHRLYVNAQLQQLPGVGRKVADCVAVFSLDQTHTVPVDVHVYDIAARDYDTTLLDSSKTSITGQLSSSLTPKLYERVGDLFRYRFGTHAGWAHSVLFAAELPPFKYALPQVLQEEMKVFDEQQRARKKEFAQAKKSRKAAAAATTTAAATTAAATAATSPIQRDL